MRAVNLRKIKLLFASAVGIAAVFVTFGQGCGQAPDATSGSNSFGNGQCVGNAVNVIDKNFSVIPGEATVSISYGRQLLDNYVSCTGLGSPSQRTIDEWTRRSQSLSEYGSLTDVSGAMMMAVTAVAGEICKDIIDRELALAPGERAIFGEVNLQGTGLSSAEIRSTAQMLALSCWQRPFTAQEETMIQQSIGSLNANSSNGALGLCTAMLSSLEAIKQ